jgi:RNA polymerase sigma-70 factor (ECF subfamily)
MDRFRRTGDRAVFDDLVQRNAPMLRRMILSRLRGSSAAIDVNDVLQDTFFNIYRYPSRFRADRPAAFRVWASTIVRNTVHRHLRRAMRRGVRSESSADLLLLSPDPGPSPAEELVSSDEVRTASSCFALLLLAWSAAYHELRERDRRVLQLVEVEGLPYRDAAAALGVRPGNLKMLVFRARRRIAARIAGAFEQAPSVARA